MSKKIGVWVMLVFAGTLAVAACDDNPLSEDRDAVDRLVLNPSFANVKVNDSTFVSAIAVNKHGEPLGVAVTATACDNRITLKNDPTRTEFEPPERFIIRGVTAGNSCVNVSSNGKQGTVTVRVVP